MQITLLVGALAFWCSHAFGADVPKEMIDMNIRACEKIKASPILDKDSYHPDAEHLTSFCTCSTQAYFNKLLPESEWQETKTNPMKYVPQQSDSPDVVKQKREQAKAHTALVKERLKQADAMCKN